MLLRDAIHHDPVHRQLDSGTLAAASAAALLRVRHARHELLRGKGTLKPGVELRVCLEHGHGRDRPTGAATALSANLGRGRQVLPMPLRWEDLGGIRERGVLEQRQMARPRARGGSRGATAAVAAERGELLVAPVPQLVDASRPPPLPPAVLLRGLRLALLIVGATLVVLGGVGEVCVLLRLQKGVEGWDRRSRRTLLLLQNQGIDAHSEGKHEAKLHYGWSH
mmetsp:Transcript_86755/g.280344  ORF Transcript_86755/g.280344 Transcript_86755/m.280344 type:complete len:223 (+) Transcript_86755:760-1428(+)